MGAEGECRARVRGRPDRGRALLETNEVVFRGAERVVVELAAVRKSARVKGGWLTLGELEARGLTVSDVAQKGAQLVFLRVTSAADLKQLPRLRKLLADDGALRLLRPKGKNAPVSEAETMAAGKAAGLVDIKVVGFSETLSAEKYVVPLAKRK